MIDDFVIFERGGTVLWRRTFVRVRGDPIATLVRDVLLEDKASETELKTKDYGVRWVLSNQYRLVIAVVYQKLLPPAYTLELLELVRSKFTAQFSAALTTLEYDDTDFEAFDQKFDKLLNDAEQNSLRRARNARVQRAPATNPPAKNPPPDGADGPAPPPPATPPVEQNHGSAEDETRRNREAFIRKRTGTKKKQPAPDPVKTQKRGKVMRPSKSGAAEDTAKLDFSAQDEHGDAAEVERVRKQFRDGAANTEYDLLDVSDDEDSEQPKRSTLSGGVFSYFKGLAGMHALTAKDLEPALDRFREALIAKNVAQEIADSLLQSVAVSLEGQKLETMTSVSTTVRNALDKALTRILTPKQSTDLLADIAANAGGNRPYVIAYCGVNGVGKSTSVAKTTYYLRDNGYNVMIAACDTFRAGAVEQLRTHVKCLGEGVTLFEKGYGKDAAAVASEAIRRAKDSGIDVVLIDTAGRMQDNEPLMKALAKLVQVNRPDRLFFVGEALVGNDAVDQLNKFNRALEDNQTTMKPRKIDGIILTKFDTIDDKVGAAVSMVYTTGQPIVFVGVGQTYMDLRKMNSKALVRALLR